MTKAEKKLVKSILWRLVRMEGALKFRKERYRIRPKTSFYRNFPGLKDRKFYLERWLDDRRIKVWVSGNRNPQYYAASYFEIA